MKKIISAFLCACTLLTLASCAGEDANVEITTAGDLTTTESQTTAEIDLGLTPVGENASPIILPGVQTEHEGFYKVKSPLTWEKISSFPIKSNDMTVDERRQLCVDFFRFTKNVKWVPDESFSFSKKQGTTPDSMQSGSLYGGLPYVSYGSGNVYRLLDYMNTDGVVDISAAVDIADTESDLYNMSQSMKLFGNQCSIGAYWGWSRVVNSARYSFTEAMTHANGFLRVGPYTYSDTITSFSAPNSTKSVVQANGEQTMFESYACLKTADGLVKFNSAGHTIMCASDAYVVRNADGSIDGSQSYIRMIDQTTAWNERISDEGELYSYKGNVDKKITFNSLISSYYLPFTFEEFTEGNVIEETECVFSHTKQDITAEELRLAWVEANYGISDAYVILRDKDGELVRVDVNRAEVASVYDMVFTKTVQVENYTEYADKGYTVEIVLQLSTGERPVLYRGKLVSAQ